uniref:Uncharacterized protein n=1 Tax=Oryza glaberrima TaxID=4538 RepID=A0A679BCC2_ORYGL|nr:hypothetical protein [Oryza glaberrima]BBF89559.1 hypothetical protein [Oryza glaberrima]
MPLASSKKTPMPVTAPTTTTTTICPLAPPPLTPTPTTPVPTAPPTTPPQYLTPLRHPPRLLPQAQAQPPLPLSRLLQSIFLLSLPSDPPPFPTNPTPPHQRQPRRIPCLSEYCKQEEDEGKLVILHGSSLLN